MARRKPTFATVRRLGLALPDVTVSTCYGKPSLEVGGKMFVCVPSHRSAERGSLVVRMDFDQRGALLAEAPDAYYLPDHYVGYPCILVRLSRVSVEALDDLVRVGHRFVSQPRRKGRGRSSESRPARLP